MDAPTRDALYASVIDPNQRFCALQRAYTLSATYTRSLWQAIPEPAVSVTPRPREVARRAIPYLVTANARRSDAYDKYGPWPQPLVFNDRARLLWPEPSLRRQFSTYGFLAARYARLPEPQALEARFDGIFVFHNDVDIDAAGNSPALPCPALWELAYLHDVQVVVVQTWHGFWIASRLSPDRVPEPDEAVRKWLLVLERTLRRRECAQKTHGPRTAQERAELQAMLFEANAELRASGLRLAYHDDADAVPSVAVFPGEQVSVAERVDVYSRQTPRHAAETKATDFPETMMAPLVTHVQATFQAHGTGRGLAHVPGIHLTSSSSRVDFTLAIFPGTEFRVRRDRVTLVSRALCSEADLTARRDQVSELLAVSSLPEGVPEQESELEHEIEERLRQLLALRPDSESLRRAQHDFANWKTTERVRPVDWVSLHRMLSRRRRKADLLAQLEQMWQRAQAVEVDWYDEPGLEAVRRAVEMGVATGPREPFDLADVTREEQKLDEDIEHMLQELLTLRDALLRDVEKESKEEGLSARHKRERLRDLEHKKEQWQELEKTLGVLTRWRELGRERLAAEGSSIVLDRLQDKRGVRERLRAMLLQAGQELEQEEQKWRDWWSDLDVVNRDVNAGISLLADLIEHEPPKMHVFGEAHLMFQPRILPSAGQKSETLRLGENGQAHVFANGTVRLETNGFDKLLLAFKQVYALLALRSETS
jgi:hypothetical protein